MSDVRGDPRDQNDRVSYDSPDTFWGQGSAIPTMEELVTRQSSRERKVQENGENDRRNVWPAGMLNVGTRTMVISLMNDDC